MSSGYYLSDLIDEDETIYQSELTPLIILQKKNKKDFALWKGRTNKDVGFDAEFEYHGEKISAWGRPGWHIECSCMIHETTGSDLDIHFGGIDLKFPHHQNERLQAHAYYHPKFKPTNNDSVEATKQWSTDFFHIGHLCIKGLKMSKSLKNFTTIDDALHIINANQLRWMFITHKWSDFLDFNDETIRHAKVFDETITNFFNRITNYPFEMRNIVYDKNEFELNNCFDESKNKIMLELSVFKFDIAIQSLAELINKTNAYINIGQPNETIVRKIYDWMLVLITNLGFIYQKNTSLPINKLMNVLINTRTAIRELTRDKTVLKEVKAKLFNILDTERNIELPKIGITLQDTKESSSWFEN